MSVRRLRYVLWLFAAPVFCATINVTGYSAVTFHSGDSLSFAITAPGYQAHAAAYGAPAYPTGISFSLLSAPAAEDWSLSAEIAPRDGSASAAFPTLYIGPAYMHGVEYQGPVLSIRGSLQLSPEASRAIFSAPSARLVLRNNGGDTTLGLSPYTLPKDLVVSVSGGALQVGAVVVGASLEQDSEGAPVSYDLSLPAEFVGPGASADVPEPLPASLLAGGALMLAFARIAKLRRRGAAQ